MNLTLPIYVESSRPGGGATVYRARPLFFGQPEVRGERLERVLTRLAQDLAQRLNRLGKAKRHEDLADYTFSPQLRTQRLDLTLALRRRTARCRFLFVTFRHFGRRLAFTPGVPEVWFDLARSELLADRAGEMLTRHFRDLEREDPECDPEMWSLKGTAYVTPLEIAVRPPAVPPAPPKTEFLMLGSQAPVDGAAELRRVGRCLDWQYPDELDRIVLRDAELAELTQMLDSGEHRPLLLVGPRQVGKTALIHEFVYRRVCARRSAFRDRGNVWLLAPARLISGMSYVGQWENRLLAILKETRRRRHILYFDDLLGLFLAGQSGCSTLSVADVLKPYLERREVQVLGEITPEALRVLRERDRGFADLFHLLPLREPSDQETLRILLEVQRQLEGRHRCFFGLDVLPVVLDLQRRYARGVAFPGKAATFLRQLAVKYQGGAADEEEPLIHNDEVGRAHVLKEFRRRSGLAVTFLDREARLDRQEVFDNLARQVIGQDDALNAAADAISVAKARLNDPDRPLAVFLFLGPTGVGKTECAKALARFLFGDEERLLRFDLNEYGEPGSAARLVGTFSQPEGLLTAALRRQPFAVLLFDEVEKAHPEVFDLLLQVLGEGRLTDALGRTADFTNALIVLTSNLGVRESEGRFGLREDDTARDAVFVQAAERFFRPEFFNRLDRVIPFRRLTREHVRVIAGKLMGDVFAREGLVQRKCLLAVEAPALERVIDQGYDPVLGARALKRAVERHLAQPVAEQLAELPPGAFTIVRVYPGPEALTVRVRPLEEATLCQGRAPGLEDAEGMLRRIRSAVRRIEDEFAVLRPEGPLTLGQVSAEQYRYFVLREQIEHVRARVRELSDVVEEDQLGQRVLPIFRRPDALRPHRTWRRGRSWWRQGHDRLLQEMASALDINEYLREVAASATPAVGPHAEELQSLLGQVALLRLLADSLLAPSVESVVLWPLALGAGGRGAADQLLDLYRESLPALRLEVTAPKPIAKGGAAERFCVLHGPHALAVARLEAGIHLFCPAHAAVEPVRLVVLPVEPGTEPAAVVRDWVARRQRWLEALARGEAVVEDPLNPGPVLRVYGEQTGVVDLRTGLTGGAGVGACLLAALPLPPEITDDVLSV
ncbi:MAG TPA: AAA family ATPase [Gemmataceae bacterium]|nr:AAA family ATPase [Gemmataceae bacterium]